MYSKRLTDGRSHKTINLALAIVRRILNLAARSWRDEESGKVWLETPPLNRISNECNRVNRSLVMIAREAMQDKVPQKSPDNKKGLKAISL